MKYQKKTGMSLFEQENTMESLSKMGNPLVLLKEIVDFEQFRDELEKLFTNDSKKNNAGRKPIDPVFMLKVLFLQRLYNISDNQVEYQIKDRMSFREFLDICSVDDVPDEKTVWKYKNIMANAGIGIKLFEKFNEQLASMGLIVNEEQKENNRVKSKTRCRIEHVYGFMEQSMKGLFFRGVGMVRATFYIGFTNLVYNMCRLVQIKRYHPDWIMN